MSSKKLISRSPLGDQVLKTIPTTSVSELKTMFQKAYVAQKHWAQLSVKQRAQSFIYLKECFISRLKEIQTLITQENGKPPFEALSADLLPSIDLLSYFICKAPRFLKNQALPLHHPFLLHRKSYLEFWPLGTVAVISPWNFPFFLPFAEIVMNLLAGNAVIFKPSEHTSLTGLKIQDLFKEAGFPPGLLQTAIGAGEVGAAILAQKPAKIFFTGSVRTGKLIAQEAGKHLIPVCLELGGKDAMLVLPDASLEHASSAALWGAFSNSGQVCASIERIFVHHSLLKSFCEKLVEKLKTLRIGNPLKEPCDLGAMTVLDQLKICETQIEQAKKKGSKILIGGKKGAHTFEPTVVLAKDPKGLSVFEEETFGPVVAISSFQTLEEGIEKVNQSPYGLTACVFTSDLDLGREVASQLEVGTVMINEVSYTASFPEAPWGGVKASGIGKKHSKFGLLECVHMRHVHQPRFSFFSSMKSFWWFPYTPFQAQMFFRLCETYRKSWIEKFKSISLFLWNFVHFLKKEKRL